MFRVKSILAVAGGGALVVALNQACTKQSFRASSDKQKVLMQSSVLSTGGTGSGSDPTPGSSQGSGNDPFSHLPGSGGDPFGGILSGGGGDPSGGAPTGGGGDPIGNPTGYGNDPTPPPANGVGADPTHLPVKFFCDDDVSNDYRANVLQASSLVLTVTDPATGAVVCTVSDDKASIESTKALDFSSCTQMSGNTYNVTVTDPDVKSAGDCRSTPNFLLTPQQVNNQDDNCSPITITRSSSTSNWTVTVSSSKGATSSQPDVAIIYGQNNERDKNCDVFGASPLIIDIAQDAQNSHPVNLTSPLKGILFDILGINSNPAPHTPKRISWMRNHNYMFLALPDENGQVHGIDQLFGNNTVGPDGETAPNGFLALGKFDSNHDQVIDSRDPIFKQLRVWSDVNFDGKSEAGELYSMDQVGISQIDLNYDGNFSEVDRFGNQVKYKSVVKFDDGSLHLIFDLWFSLKANPN